MNKNNIKVSLVDDEALFVEGLSYLLSNVDCISIVGTSNSGGAFLQFLEGLTPDEIPDIALVDVEMPEMNGFQLVEILRKKYPNLKIIVLSSHYKANVLGHMLKLGISAFIPKDSKIAFLTEVIETVYKSGVFLTTKDQRMIQEYMNGKFKKIQLSAKQKLTPREIEVLKLICQEKTNQEIADQLILSKRTIESHRQRIMDKIEAKNTVGLVIYAIANEIHPLARV